MNFIKRGLTSVIRKKSKSIILLILVFVLGNVIVGAISIEQAVTNAEKNIRRQIGGIVTIDLDWGKLPLKNEWELDYDKVEFITSKIIDDMGKLPYVKYYDYKNIAGVEATEIKRYMQEEENEWMSYWPPEEVKIYESQFTLTGVNYLEIMDFKEGNGKLLQGRTFREDDLKSDKNVAIITKTVAEKNNLSVGSTITLGTNLRQRDLNWLTTDGYKEPSAEDYKIVHEKNLEFEVVGIYEPKREIQKDDNNFGIYVDEYKENEIYTLNKTVKELTDFIMNIYIELEPEYASLYGREYLTPVFILNDALDIDAFEEEAGTILPEYYMFSNTKHMFDSVAGPMKNIKWIASITLYVAIGATLVILSLLITLFLKDRKYEMGIYLSLGEKRIKVMGQIVLEVVLISFIGITLSLFSGNVLAGKMSSEMLKNQLVSEQEKKENDMMPRGEVYVSSVSYGMYGSSGYETEVTMEDIMESYKVSIGLTTVLMFYAIGLGTVLLSTLVPNIYILRMNPKKIMM